MPLRTGLRPPLAGRAGRLEPKLRRVSERGQRHLRDVAGHFVPGEGEEREMGGGRGYSDQRACLDTRNGPGERGSDLRWCQGAGTQAGRDSSSYLPLLPQRRAPGSLFRRLSRTSPSPWGQDSPCGCSGILQPEGESAGSSKPRSAAGDFRFQVKRGEGLALPKRQRLRTGYCTARSLTLTRKGLEKGFLGSRRRRMPRSSWNISSWGARGALTPSSTPRVHILPHSTRPQG